MWKTISYIGKSICKKLVGTNTVSLSAETSGLPWENTLSVIGAVGVSTIDKCYSFSTSVKKVNNNTVTVESVATSFVEKYISSHTLASGSSLYNYSEPNKTRDGSCVIEMQARWRLEGSSSGTPRSDYGYSGDIFVGGNHYCYFMMKTKKVGTQTTSEIYSTKGEMTKTYGAPISGGRVYYMVGLSIVIDFDSMGGSNGNVEIRNFSSIDSFSNISAGQKSKSIVIKDLSYSQFNPVADKTTSCLLFSFETLS